MPQHVCREESSLYQSRTVVQVKDAHIAMTLAI